MFQKLHDVPDPFDLAEHGIRLRTDEGSPRSQCDGFYQIEVDILRIDAQVFVREVARPQGHTTFRNAT
jgi:hypothetical protein